MLFPRFAPRCRGRYVAGCRGGEEGDFALSKHAPLITKSTHNLCTRERPRISDDKREKSFSPPSLQHVIFQLQHTAARRGRFINYQISKQQLSERADGRRQPRNDTLLGAYLFAINLFSRRVTNPERLLPTIYREAFFQNQHFEIVFSSQIQIQLQLNLNHKIFGHYIKLKKGINPF